MLEWQVFRLRADISLGHRAWHKANLDSTGRARRRYNRPRSVSRLESMTWGRTRRGPQSIYADCGAAGARTQMAGVCTPLDRDNLPGRVTRLLRMERGEGDTGRARLDRVEGGDSRRTGPSRTTTKMYSWESVTSLSMTR